MRFPHFFARFTPILLLGVAACAADDPADGAVDDASAGKLDGVVDSGDGALQDLGLLPFPGEVLGGQTIELAPGEALRFQIDGNQIFGVFGFDVEPADLRVEAEVVEDGPEALGDTTRWQFDVRTPEGAPAGTDYTLVSQTPFQVVNDPRWAFTFHVLAVE